MLIALALRYADQLTSVGFSMHGPARADLYTLSLHDALPISLLTLAGIPTFNDGGVVLLAFAYFVARAHVKYARATKYANARDRKSTRLNSSHSQISYAVFCLKKKKTANITAPVSKATTIER